MNLDEWTQKSLAVELTVSPNHRVGEERNQIKEPIPDPHPLAVTVSRACELASIGRTAMYALIQEGRIKTVKIGNRRLVLRSSLEALLAA